MYMYVHACLEYHYKYYVLSPVHVVSSNCIPFPLWSELIFTVNVVHESLIFGLRFRRRSHLSLSNRRSTFSRQTVGFRSHWTQTEKFNAKNFHHHKHSEKIMMVHMMKSLSQSNYFLDGNCTQFLYKLVQYFHVILTRYMYTGTIKIPSSRLRTF